MIYCYNNFANWILPLINQNSKLYKASKLYLYHKPVYRTTKYTARQGRSYGGHVGHCRNLTSLYEYFFWFMSKARYSCFWSPQSKFLATPNTALMLPVKHIWNRYQSYPSQAQAIVSMKKMANMWISASNVKMKSYCDVTTFSSLIFLFFAFFA